MRKKLLFLTFLCLSFFCSLTLSAQEEPYTLQVFNQAVYYGMYEATVSEPVPSDAIRNSNSSYGKMITEEQLASFGNTLTMRVTLNPLCDNYDRIGNVNLAFVPKGQTTYVYNEVQRIELGRFITPFMNKNNTTVQEVPYEWQLDNITQIFHDESITSEFDLWVELEVYGYQGWTDGTDGAGAAHEIAGCANRNDVYQGSLEFISTDNPLLINGENTFIPLSYKYELKNYTLDGTDVLGETVRTINFTLEEDVPNAKFYLITSNHGSGQNGEEYVRRQHYVYLDGEQVFTYKPGGISCMPFFNYNTMPSCIYYNCNTGNPMPDNDAYWYWNNWCPGDKIPVRVIELGDLEAGEHSFKIDVPDAQFSGGEGYFPMSVYMQGFSQTLGVEDFNTTAFTLFPNPVVDIAEIQTVDGSSIRNVTVVNTLGQIVYSGTSEKVNLSQLQSGVYIVNVRFDDNRTATQKLIKN